MPPLINLLFASTSTALFSLFFTMVRHAEISWSSVYFNKPSPWSFHVIWPESFLNNFILHYKIILSPNLYYAIIKSQNEMQFIQVFSVLLHPLLHLTPKIFDKLIVCVHLFYNQLICDLFKVIKLKQKKVQFLYCMHRMLFQKIVNL